MPKTKKTTKSTATTTSERRAPTQRRRGIVLTMGCPSGIGPEVVLAACLSRGAPPTLVVGDRGALWAAAQALGIETTRLDRFFDYRPGEPLRGVHLLQPGPPLSARERRWGKPSAAAGKAQLGFVEAGFQLARELGLPLVTGPVSKEAIAHSGLRRAVSFRGHTEWLEHLDGAPYSVMCFASPRLVTGLVTTHIPLSQVPSAVTAQGVTRGVVELADLAARLGAKQPRIAVCSINPHAGEGELLGSEEKRAIAPGIERAKLILGRRAKVAGPIGAETAYRKGAAGTYDAVLAMYHDQATIPMKLLDFGGAVNVTQGLSIVRTSVDHGTAYDIAGTGRAAPSGLLAAIAVAERLGSAARRVPSGPW